MHCRFTADFDVRALVVCGLRVLTRRSCCDYVVADVVTCWIVGVDIVIARCDVCSVAGVGATHGVVWKLCQR